MRVLILSCNTGGGHNTCANAIQETVQAHGDECVTEDALCFISANVSRVISRGHITLYRRFPRLFRSGYRFTEQHQTMFRENSGLYRFFGKGAEKLYTYLVYGGYSAVICTHPFAALMLTDMLRRHPLSVKTVFIATDYTCSPSVKDSALDYYCIPAEELIDDFRCERIIPMTIVPSGIPIRRMFYTHTEKDEAKLAVGVSPFRNHIVISCGSMGCGPIRKLTKMLASGMKDDTEISVVCGTNKRLQAQLETQYSGHARIHIHGYVGNMSQMLDSADLYVTKAGGISTTEALVKRVPMVLVDAVGGCEDYNSDFFVRHGCAVKGKNVRELTEQCLHLTANEADYRTMLENMEQFPLCNAAQTVYAILKPNSKE